MRMIKKWIGCFITAYKKEAGKQKQDKIIKGTANEYNRTLGKKEEMMLFNTAKLFSQQHRLN